MRALIAGALGALGVLGFAPFAQHWLLLIALVVLLWMWADAGPGAAFVQGLCFGIGLFGAGVSWVYVSLHVYGNMPPAMAVAVVLLFVLFLALYPACVGWLQARIGGHRRGLRLLLLVPALWALAEWLRGWLLSGFPWLSVGYSQVDTALAGWAPVLGIYGVGLSLMLTAALPVALVRSRRRAAWMGALAALGVCWVGGWLLARVEWSQPVGEQIRVALVQGNVALDTKWAPASRLPILQRYLALTEDHADVDLVVWPESAAPFHLDELPAVVLRRLGALPADVVLGILERHASPGGWISYNSVLAVSDGGTSLYRKVHLVPFGEFLPLKTWLQWILNYLKIPMADFTPWREGQSPLAVAGTQVGVSVCYEDAFPDQIRRLLPEANLLLNVSEDAWFGDSLAPHQRVQMARMRAMESARPMLRAANTGVSAIIDHMGRLVKASPQFEQFVLLGVTQPMAGVTPYVRYGDALVMAIGGLFLLGAALVVRLRA